MLRNSIVLIYAHGRPRKYAASMITASYTLVHYSSTTDTCSSDPHRTENSRPSRGFQFWKILFEKTILTLMVCCVRCDGASAREQRAPTYTGVNDERTCRRRRGTTYESAGTSGRVAGSVVTSCCTADWSRHGRCSYNYYHYYDNDYYECRLNQPGTARRSSTVDTDTDSRCLRVAVTAARQMVRFVGRSTQRRFVIDWCSFMLSTVCVSCFQ